jgi:hypothetical protein
MLAASLFGEGNIFEMIKTHVDIFRTWHRSAVRVMPRIDSSMLFGESRGRGAVR